MRQIQLQTFQLDTPLQLLLKLAWGINQLKASLESTDRASNFYPSVYIAFDCAITAWQMTDWVWKFYKDSISLPLSEDPRFSGAEPFKRFQAWVREQSNDLRICMHIANSNKHFGVDRHPDPHLKTPVEHNVVASFTAGSTAGDPIATHYYNLVVIDKGTRHEILQVLRETCVFWALQINEPSVIGLLDD